MAMAITQSRRATHELWSEPNVIPFIDVLLVLLIIFMVTAPKPTVDIQVELPNRTTPAPVLIPPTIVDLRAAPSGYAIFIGERHVAEGALASTVLAYALSNDAALTEADVYADARIYVRADDQGIAYGAVVDVLDDLQHAGYAKVGVFSQLADGA